MIRTALIFLFNEIGLCLLKRPLYSPVFIENEKKLRKADIAVSVSDRNWWNKRGFLSNKSMFYEKDKVGLYISDLQRRILTERINKFYRIVVHDKFVFYRFLSPLAQLIPVKMLVSRNGQITSIKDDTESLNSLLNDLEQGRKYIIKPINGGGGRDVEMITYSEQVEKFAIGDRYFNAEEFKKAICNGGRAVIQPQIEPAGYSRKVYPGSLNTMRVITMIDPKSNEPFVAAVSHKFGTSKIGVIDNWMQGGFLCSVNVTTGEMGAGCVYPKSKADFKLVDCHPDTQFRVNGFKIPNWESFIAQMKELALNLEFLAFLGWDVAWDGEKILVVEANYNPDMTIIQCFEPLLESTRVRRFYEHHGVIQKGN